MRWQRCVVTSLGAVAPLLASAVLVPVGASAATPRAAMSAGSLASGSELVSSNGRFHARLASGRLTVRDRSGRLRWATTTKRTRATTLRLTRRGDVQLKRGGRVFWASHTAGGGSARLTMRNDGVLALTADRLLVWSSTVPNRCPHGRGKTLLVDISSQTARMCKSGTQVRATPVTTGASKKGNGTPRGSWRIYAKTRNTVLRPSSGGRYPVKYWLPYDGAYGVHDSSWQKFAYGSQKYKTSGSHGCTHVPARAMAWLFRWSRVGTRVTVQR